MNLWTSDGLLISLIRSGVFSYAGMILMAVAVFIVERRRIRGVGFAKKVLITLLWPLFLAIQLPMDIQAFFSKNLGWKPIPHSDKTTFEHVNPPTGGSKE